MSIICGADGCRAGWLAITKNLGTGAIDCHLFATAKELIHNSSAPFVIALDIPIGLPERGPRDCDLRVRRILGQGRASSVFPAPTRPVLAATSYNAACGIRFKEEGKKLSRQSWGIVQKIRDVDQVLCQDLNLQSRVREVHPELSFFTLAGGRPMRYSKKKKEGKDERYRLLEPWFGQALQTVLKQRKHLASTEDDILDAFATLWTAERIASGIARTIPSLPPKDTHGLRMEIIT